MLESLYPAAFVGGALTDCPEAAGAIFWAEDSRDLAALAARGVESLAILAPATPAVAVDRGRVTFSDAPAVDRCFRRATLRERGVAEFTPLRRDAGDDLICTLDGEPGWIRRRHERGSVSIVALEPPLIQGTDTLYRHFNRLQWLRLLPFLEFVQRLTREHDWTPPPLRACLMFDDPNLHWGRYGFIDYHALARHAEEHNYHAAFATVPADGWYVHAATAQLFREQPAHLSLLMHGNNHESAELGRERSLEEFAGTLAQALRRIDGFERRSGLAVARVMAPPYGAFSVGAANTMLQLGYEAVCVSRASITSWNQHAAWPVGFGGGPAEFLADGLPLIPRHVLAPEQIDTYRLAAFLGQPIIPHGHQHDCAGGLDLLADIAAAINGLGAVRWCNLTELCRSNYQTRREGDTLLVRMFARQVTLPPPEPDVRRLVVVRPWLESGESHEEPLFCQQGDQLRHAGTNARVSREIPLGGPLPIALHAPPRATLNPAQLAPPSRRVWPVVRRLLAEGRDRLTPLVARPRRTTA